jgi:RNA-directed DNA polymerase
VTAHAYAAHREARRANLDERLRRGPYRVPPGRRTSLEQEDGSQRPRGIPAVEDTIGQRAVVMRLGAIDEQDFWACAHGFRPGRSPHQARQEWREPCMAGDSGGSVDADVRACFDSVEQALVRERRRHRVAAGTSLGRIGKGRTAGVVEGATLRSAARGSPQGGVRSPLLAEVVLHYVLDEGCEREVRPRMQGRCWLCRVADDCVVGGEREDAARRILVVLPTRCARFGLTMHPPTTRLVACRQPGRTRDPALGTAHSRFAASPMTGRTRGGETGGSSGARPSNVGAGP